MSTPNVLPDHYTTLGLGRRCTLSQIRAAYRLLAAEHHPDRNPNSDEALARMQALNEAYETLSDPTRRRIYNLDLDARERETAPRGRIDRSIAQDVLLPVEAFFRGTSLDVSVNDPADPAGGESYRLEIPAGTAPGTRFTIPRTGRFEGGSVKMRVKARPGFRFKARNSDLRCDLRINASRAAQGGTEMMQGPDGKMLRIPIPAGVGRSEVLRLRGEGLPKLRGGRGDLFVRVTYRPEIRITHAR